MYNVIVGTAGHVDHGKTCLIKALTGVDTDRLKEEKKRGITIELGFAEMHNDRGLKIGVIDVPGHEKFIKNMLAGISGIDFVLLVIAADESVMPQTVEHFEILKMLHVDCGLVVVTKSDLADEEWMEIVRDDIKRLTAGTFLENAPVVEVSAYTGQNIGELAKIICDMADKAGRRKPDQELLRIPVDRVFTIDGFGTVVTGTLIEGAVSVGDEVSVYPSGRAAKIRNLQVHGNMVGKAYAGQRTALNLTNIKKEELKRGDVLAAKGSLKATKMLDVKIDMFQDSPRTLVSGSRLHLYYGSAEVLCKAVLLSDELLESGESGYAQLRLEEEIAVRKGDRFILRFYSPLASIGGGVVLNPCPPKRKRFNEETLRALSIKETGSAEEILEQTLLEESDKMTDIAEIGRLAGLNGDETATLANYLDQKNKTVHLTESITVHRNYLESVCEKTSLLLKRFHEENPFRQGMPKEEFRRKLGSKLFLKDNRLVEILTDRMISENVIADNGNIITLAGFCVTYTPEILSLKDNIEDEYLKLGVETPEIEEFSLRFKEKERPVVSELSEVLRREGHLEKLAYNCYIHNDCLENAIMLLKGHISEKGSITLSEYRDMLGTSRKYAIRILEYLDAKKVTRLNGDARILIS